MTPPASRNVIALARIAVLTAVALAPAAAFAQAPDVDLLTPAREPSARAALGTERGDEVRQRAVRLDVAALESAARSGRDWSARVPLFDGAAVQVLLKAGLAYDPEATTWTGYLLDDPSSTLVATYRAGQLVADISTSSGSYRLRPVSGGLHRLVQVDPLRSRPEGLPVPVDVPAEPADRFPGIDFGGTGGSGGGDSGPPDLDLLFAYTRDARKGGGGPGAVQSQILNMVAWMNLALGNVEHEGRARIVGIVPTEYETRSGDMLDSLEDLRRGAGALRDLHAERDRVGADMVVLIQEEGNHCGQAYLMQSPGSSFSSYAFGVILRECTTSLTHEVGHLLGAHHERDVPGSDGAYSYSHGQIAADGAWSTVMSLGRSCAERGLSCPRIPYFSDPSTSFGRDALGEDGVADNARTLASTWSTASNFRARRQTLEEPARLRLRSRGGRVVLKWKKSRVVDGYQILRSSDDGRFQTIGQAAGQAKKYVDRGVNMRTTSYCYQVVATDGSTQAIAGPVCTGR